MDKQILDKLNEILDARDAKEQKLSDMRSERENQENAFLGDFLKRRSAIYRPALESFAQVVEGRGIKTYISEAEDQPPKEGAYQSASIGITFFIGERNGRSLTDFPNFSIACVKHSQKIRLYQSTIAPNRGGSAGSLGEVDINTITEGDIHKYLLAVIQSSFS